jgi:hypothetical protein
VAWPVRLDDAVPIALRVHGRVIRNDGRGCVIGFRTYEFVITRRRAAPVGAPGNFMERSMPLGVQLNQARAANAASPKPPLRVLSAAG